jgi:hypothetical protein
MQRRQAHLRAVAHQQENERHAQEARLQRVGVADQVREEQGAALGLGRGQEEGAEERQRDADRGEHQVFPDGFQRAPGPAMEHEERQRQRGGLHADPEQRHVMRQRHEAGRGQERQEAGDEDPPVALRPHLQESGRVDRHRQEHQADHRQHQDAERVGGQPVTGRRPRPATRARAARQVQPATEQERKSACRDPAGGSRAAPPGAGTR